MRERAPLVSRGKVKEAEMFGFDSGLLSFSTLNRKCRLKPQQHTEDLSARVRSGPHWLFLKHLLKLFFSLALFICLLLILLLLLSNDCAVFEGFVYHLCFY